MSALPWDITLDGYGLLLVEQGTGIQKKQAQPFAMKSSAGERSWADIDPWATWQVSSLHRGMGIKRWGDPEQFWWGKNVDTRFKDKIVLGPTVTSLSFSDTPGAGASVFGTFGDKIFMSVDKKVYELVTTTWTLRETLTAACTGMAEFNGYFYVAQGTSYSMRKTANGTSWSDVGGTPSADVLYVHGGYLYRSVNQALYYSSDPDDASPTWSSIIYVDDSQYIVEKMQSYQDSLVAFKNNGAWKIPGTPGDVDVAYPIGELNWNDTIDQQNGMAVCVWVDGFLYVSHGKGGVLRWTGRTVQPIGLDIMETGDIHGKVVALIPTSNFLYAILAPISGTEKCHIIAWNGSGWHHVAETAAAGESAALAGHYFDPRSTSGGYLYFSVQGSTNNTAYRIYMPSEYLDPQQVSDSTYTYSTETDCVLYTPDFTANMHAADKEFRRVTVWTENYGTSGTGTQTVKVEYRVDTKDDSYFITLGTLTVAVDNHKHEQVLEWSAPTGWTDVTVSSVESDGVTVNLASGSTTTGMAVGDWVYSVSSNEYRYIVSITDSDTFVVQCPWETDPTANSTIRPGVPWGKEIDFRFTLTTTANTRTPVIRAFTLRYLVNIQDYHVWQLKIPINSRYKLRNGAEVRREIEDQLDRLKEIRLKGRVAFVDEWGDSYTVKVTNYSEEITRQEVTDSGEFIREYWVRLTLLEV